MSYEYSENSLVQESAANLLRDELGWNIEFAYNREVLGVNGTLGRESYKEILLKPRFRKALKRLNPWINDKQIQEAENLFSEFSFTEDLLQINEKKFALIRDGIPVSVIKQDGSVEEKKAKVIDFRSAENNDFFAVKEMKIHGDIYRRRTDIVGFVNGIPLLFIELKAHNVDIYNAYVDNYTDYLSSIPQLFRYNAFLILSNGTNAKVGTLGSKFEFFHEWKRLEERDSGTVELRTMLRGICKKENFLDLLENFIVFDHSDGKTVKILARNHQYLGVNEAVKSYENRAQNKGKLGVFWHTQGSGKSYSMVFFAQKIKRRFEGSPTIVVLTDRDELNKQISDTFLNCGLLGNVTESAPFLATSGDDLVEKLRGNPSFIFSLIQKFNKPNEKPIKPDHDIIVMSDEAHRSQYGIFAENMMRLIPTACRIGFTGTPLLANDNITERVFGGYVSVYDFKRAVDDGATVPLYYENRGEKILHLENPEMTDRILEAIENADLDSTQQEKLENEFKKEIHILTAEPRLRSIAKDFARYYSDLWTTGKAMFVCLNKITCVRMFNYVQEYWKEEIELLKNKIAKTKDIQEAQELNRKLTWMTETEMAVVVSQEQNEAAKFQKWGLDILPHRKKMDSRELDKEFKQESNPFRVVFVCAMWLTGFDVKSLSCLFLDKPLKAHTLMQAIARANRVNQGKTNGQIIDYIGIVKALRKALADYTATQGNGNDPTVDKNELISKIEETVAQTETFLAEHNFQLQNLIEAEGFDKLEQLQIAANAMCETLHIKKTFQTYASEINKLIKYTDRNDISEDIRRKRNAITAIYDELQKKRKHSDIESLKVEINGIINEYIQLGEDQETENRVFDISKINFDLLHVEFVKSKKRNLMFKDLAELIEERLELMLKINPNRVDLYERYRKIIDEYNEEQDRVKIEEIFMELLNISQELDEEQCRYVREGFDNDEELAFFDMLRAKDLSKKDVETLKKVASDLLKKIKDRISSLDNFMAKPETRSDVFVLIRNELYTSMPESYSTDVLPQYTQKIYEYVCTHYQTAA